MSAPTLPRRTVNRAEAQLAYFAVCKALGMTVDLEDLTKMADLTHEVSDVAAAVDALRVRTAAMLTSTNPAKASVEYTLVILRSRAQGRAHGGTA